MMGSIKLIYSYRQKKKHDTTVQYYIKCMHVSYYSSRSSMDYYCFKFMQVSETLDISNYDKLYRMSIDSPKRFWGEMAMKTLHWEEPFNMEKVMDICDQKTGKIKWFDGKINASGVWLNL